MVKLCVHLASWETVVTSPPRLTLAVAKGHTTGMEEQTAGSRASRTLALLLWSSAMVLALASVVLLVLNRAVLHGPEAMGPELVIVPGFATVGAVVAARRRRVPSLPLD